MAIQFVYSFALPTLLISQVLTAATALTSASDASNLIALAAGMNISTLGIPEPPAAFDLAYDLGGPKLRQTSCLMNTIAALKELALGNWLGKVIDGTEYRLDSYPEVGISVATPRIGGNIQARFIIWAICLGISKMIKAKTFELEQIELKWEQRLLGWVQIFNHPSGPGLTIEESQQKSTLDLKNLSANAMSTNNKTEIMPINITNTVITNNTNDPTEARLNVTFTPYGEYLGIYDVFVPLMSGLADLAQAPSTRVSSGFFVGLEGYRGFICILPVVPARTSPPFLEYGWLIRTLNRVPTYMLDNGRFGELEIWVEVDQVKVAFGRFCLRPDLCGLRASLPVSLEAAKS
ncbi:hypothetical protein BDR22DRAFT_890164 [Usnea florida]